MPAAKPSRKTAKAAAKAEPKTAHQKELKADSKADKPTARSEAKSDGHTLNGIPLRRKSIWAVDTDSPQFRAARKRDAQALRETTDDRDSMQFLDAVLNEKDVQKWWN